METSCPLCHGTGFEIRTGPDGLTAAAACTSRENVAAARRLEALIERNNPSQVTSFCFITPVASVLFGWLILGAAVVAGFQGIVDQYRQLPGVVQGEVPSVLKPPPGCRFHTRCPQAMPRCRSDDPPLAAMGGGVPDLLVGRRNNGREVNYERLRGLVRLVRVAVLVAVAVPVALLAFLVLVAATGAPAHASATLSPADPPTRIPSSRASRRAITKASRSGTWRNSSMQSNQMVPGILSPPIPSTL